MATTTKAANGRHEQKQQPIFSRTFFPVQIAVFEHTSDNGRLNFSVKLTRTFRRDEGGEWESTEYLGAADLLPAARLLSAAYDVIQTRLESAFRERRQAEQEGKF